MSEKPEKAEKPEKKASFNRKHPRVEMELPGEIYETGTGAKPHHATVGNLGPEGAFVKADARIEQGAKVRLVFRIASHPLPLDCEGEVRWSRDGAGGGLGVHFLSCPAYERAAIDDYCQQRIEDARSSGGGGGS